MSPDVIHECPHCQGPPPAEVGWRAVEVERASKEYKQALEWLLGNDTGLSSETLCAHMLGLVSGRYHGFAPRDAADRGRCVRLFQRFPEWEPRLDELIELNADWAEQVPLIRDDLASTGERNDGGADRA